MKNYGTTAIHYLLISMLSAPAIADWSTNGPFGGPIETLSFHPSSSQKVFALATSGFYASNNSAGNWSAPAGLGTPYRSLSDLSVAPDSKIFVIRRCCTASEVYRSTDEGQTWKTLTSGIEDQQNRTITVDPTSSSVIYLGTSEGVYKSTNAGDTWESSNIGIEDQAVNAIAVNPISTATVYAGTNGSGVFKSIDSGTTWTASNAGIENTAVEAVVIDPDTPTNLYISTRFNSVLMSIDAGMTWASIDNGLPTKVNTLAVDPSSPSTLYAGTLGQIYRSQDSGTNWLKLEIDVEIGGAEITSLLVDPNSPDTLYAGTSIGVIKTEDSGNSWSLQTKGMQSVFVDQLLPEPGSSSTVYAAAGVSGIFKSLNSGASWQDSSNGLPSRTTSGQGVSLTISPGSTKTLYVSLLQDIFKTESGGDAWISAIDNPSDFGIIGPFVLPLAAHSTDPNVVFAGQLFPNFGDAGIYRTNDGGLSWSQVFQASDSLTLFQPTEILVDSTNSDRIFAGVLLGEENDFGFSVLRSTDGGNSWQEVLGGGGFTFPDLALDLVNPMAVTVGAVSAGGAEIFSSLDGGDTWTSLTVLDCGLNGLIADPEIEGRLFAACGSGDLFVSADRGRNWITIDTTGLPESGKLDIAVVPTSPQTLHVGTFHGVFTASLDVGSLFIFSDGFESGNTSAWSSTVARRSQPTAEND